MERLYYLTSLSLKKIGLTFSKVTYPSPITPRAIPPSSKRLPSEIWSFFECIEIKHNVGNAIGIKVECLICAKLLIAHYSTDTINLMHHKKSHSKDQGYPNIYHSILSMMDSLSSFSYDKTFVCVRACACDINI